jgi:hypothetical protein
VKAGQFRGALRWLLPLLLLLSVARFWLMPLPSGFWVDEMVTTFVVRNGAAHASLQAAPQVAMSVYYAVARYAEALFGFSEIAYRLPSTLFLALALFLIARLAARLIHPEAAWFAVFACLSLRGFNYQAADARPYALGTLAAAASLFFLVRWLDSAGWLDALAFWLSAALLWRVHLIFWPFYAVLALYAAVRLARGETPVGWRRAGAVFALLGIALLPVLNDALAVGREAAAHVIVPPPALSDLRRSTAIGLVELCGPLLWLILRRIQRPPAPFSLTSSIPILGWWVASPLCLFAFSHLTGNSVFVPRYLSLALPGAALAAAAAAAYAIPPERWRQAALVLAVGVLLFMGQWRKLWPPHHNSGWREAIAAVNRASPDPATPVVCPSPFIEAKPPVWRPDYPLPGFLYAHLAVYRLSGTPRLLPFEDSPEAERYANALAHGTLQASERFVILGGEVNVRFWRIWFSRRPELADWRCRRIGLFGDVEAVLFERGGALTRATGFGRARAAAT